MARFWARKDDMINTKWRVWLDDRVYWNYIYVNRQTGKLCVMSDESHYFEPVDDHIIREFETHSIETKSIKVDY